ncbi:flagellar basal-body rod protein FlgB [Sporomusaceae bacterium BoRhaA]|uniref:flagellar basal body rod protein FlgB n=1 Tax=Pelorhabdus rhamnosifermentans TaxID=2772457 RepID=UPI001C0601E0|nr:flagellar basal body rod protein FlgB [Pelorhabdus rhamnosifermentans]MBU2702019.1 flagellar basal-body rod protein FlgB [Pelorhabdus rhamnosifermentans]
MLDSILSSAPANILEKALSSSALRQQVISNNIANVNTPGFKRSTVSFEDKLQQAMNQTQLPLVRTHQNHLAAEKFEGSMEPSVVVDNTTSMRVDGNNVDIDKEMASLAKNSIYYSAVAQQMNKYYGILKSAIREGK